MSGGKLRIAVDGRVLVMKPTGIGHYTRSLFSEMARQQGDNLEAVFFTHGPIYDRSFWPGRLEERVLPFPDPMLARPLWDHWLLPRAIRKAGRFDLYFSPLSIVPRGLRLPSVATIHDLAFFYYPEVQPWKYRYYWSKAIQGSVKRATRLIAVSESTRNDLREMFPGVQNRVRVVHEAPSRICSSEESSAGLEVDKISRLGRYFLAVGTLEPRKNYPLLLEVFQQLLKQPGCEELKLVVAGGPGWASEELQERMAQCDSFLVRLDYVDAAQLPSLYKNALALVMPSLYEGFGLPAVEAMAAGTPVFASNVSSLPEVVGDAGLLLPVDDSEPWTRVLARAATDEAWRVRLGAQGKARAAQFSWEKAARETWQVFQEAAQR